MSVTESYKTVTFSPAARMYAAVAVMTTLKADRRELARLPDAAYDDFLKSEIAAGVEALVAINSAPNREDTNGTMQGDMLQTVIAALNFAMYTRNLAGELPLRYALEGAGIQRISFVDMEAALIFLRFLENPK